MNEIQEASTDGSRVLEEEWARFWLEGGRMEVEPQKAQVLGLW